MRKNGNCRLRCATISKIANLRNIYLLLAQFECVFGMTETKSCEAWPQSQSIALHKIFEYFLETYCIINAGSKRDWQSQVTWFVVLITQH